MLRGISRRNRLNSGSNSSSGSSSTSSGNKYVVTLSYVNSIIEKLERAMRKWSDGTDVYAKRDESSVGNGKLMKVKLLENMRTDIDHTIRQYANKKRPDNPISTTSGFPDLTPDTVPITTLELSRLSSKIDEILAKCDHTPCNCNCDCDCNCHCKCDCHHGRISIRC